MRRRAFLRTLMVLPLPRALADSLPVDGAAVAGCVNAWRRDLPPVQWSDGLALDALGWCGELVAHGIYREDGTLRHGAPGRECVARGQTHWAEAVVAWIASPNHLPILRGPAWRRVGMAGLRDGEGRWYWCLRVGE